MLFRSKLDNLQASYRDDKTGQDIAVTGFNLKTGRLEDDLPSPIAMEVGITGKRPDIGLKVSLNGAARMNLARQSFALSKLDLRVIGNAANLKGLDLKLTGDAAVDETRHVVDINGIRLQMAGQLDRDALTVALAAPRVEITSAKASGAAVNAEQIGRAHV